MTNEIILNLTAKDTATGKVVSLTEALKALKTASDKASKGTSAAAKAQKELGDEAKKTTSVLGSLKNSIARIAFYRLVRGAVKSVTQGLVEGTNNLVMYSAAMNSLDASSASRTMSEFATVSLWVKNTVASALMPILQSLVPVVDMVAEVFIFATNAINQFIKALQGGDSWTRALKYPVDYAENLKGVGRAAKEAKKQIFGFDELNIFKEPSNGGGGSTPLMDYSSMFTEEKPIDDHFKTMAAMIQENLGEIENIGGDFALAIGSILVLTGHIGLGVGAIVAGASMKWKAAGVNWDSLGNTINQKINNLIAFTAPVLMTIGLLLALASPPNLPLGIGLMVMGSSMFAVSASTGGTEALSNELRIRLERVALGASLVPLALGIILALFAPITKLPLAIGLIASGAVGLATSASMSAGLLEGTISQNLAIIAGVAGKALMAIGALLLFVPGKALVGITMLILGGVADAYSAANLDTTGLSEELKTKLAIIEGVILTGIALLGFLMLFSPVTRLKGIALLLGVGLSARATYSYSDGDFQAWLKEKLMGLLETIKQKLAELPGIISTKMEEIKSDITTKFKNAGSELVDSLKSGVSEKWESFKSWLSGKSLNVNAKVNARTDGNQYYGISGNAGGGFVDSGQMFIARENGIPEMVGSWGNQTAVANNNQIVEGIAAGVERAMMNTNSAIYNMAASVVEAINDKQINTQVISDRDIYQSAERGRTLSGRTVYA